MTATAASEGERPSSRAPRTPKTAAPGGPGRAAQCSGVRTVAHRGEPSLEASAACRAFFSGFAVTARHDASTRVHRGYQLCTNE